ncbi:MAG: aldehyde dehydrogenase family protein [Segetibacter sp.]
MKIDPTKNDSIPVTDAVIFTGTPYHAEKLLNIFDQRTLFITNGAGHNPIVVAEGSDVQKAVEATIKLQFFNSGQDCGSPNSILVHQNIYPNFLKLLRLELAKVKIGNYNDRSCRICPISETEDLKRINSLIIDNLEWLDESTRGIIRITEAIIEPAIICKPLKEGGNYTEVFAPIIFVQKYEQDDELSLYFETQQYARNAMYVTLYGVSEYINNLIGKNIYGKILHYKDTFLNNIHLHTEGVERGTPTIWWIRILCFKYKNKWKGYTKNLPVLKETFMNI